MENDLTPKDPLNYPDFIEKTFEFRISKGQKNDRLDVYLTQAVRNASRNKVRKAIDEQMVLVNGKARKASYKIQPDDLISCTIMKAPPIELLPENIPLDIFYEDDYLLVVNKPAGMVVHPAFGNRYGTLVNACLYHFGIRESIKIEIEEEEQDDENGDDDSAESFIKRDYSEVDLFTSDEIRPGIVHRIDKDTSGLLLVAKNPRTHAKLASQFAVHSIRREYTAIAWGIIKKDSERIETLIGRSPRNRKAFAVTEKTGKRAVTDYQVIERFDIATEVKLELQTGRTHQIRVHLSHLKHPIIGDSTYGGAVMAFGGGMPDTKRKAEKVLNLALRQQLHARVLGFYHPDLKKEMIFSSELPADMQQIIDLLRS